MTAINTQNVVTEAVTQALETMAYLMVMPCQPESIEPPRIAITAEINFKGPVSGSLRTTAGIDFARVLAENISGLEDLTEEEYIDAMKEFVNVTCGLVLPMIASSDADVFDITVPHLVRTEDRLKWEQFLSHDDVYILNIEGWPVATRLIIDSQNTQIQTAIQSQTQ
jgi:CheY-specific phosphatase CheX